MSFLVTTKNFFETLITEERLNKARIPYTKISTDCLEVNARFLNVTLAEIFTGSAKTVINKRQTLDGIDYHQILP